MNNKITEEFFQYILNERVCQIEDVLAKKAREYVRNEDRLHNFNVASIISNKTREDVLWNGFALKHLVSVFDMVNDINEGKLPKKELVDEKIGDLINYLILLEVSIKDKINNENSSI
jgi:hypothetical protein